MTDAAPESGLRSDLPACIAAVVDLLARYEVDRAALATRLNHALADDADVNGIASTFLLRLLNDPAFHTFAATDDAVLAARAGVVALHERVTRGLTVERQDWATARASAMNASDAADGMAKHIGALVEAAAWPPARSRTVLTDAVQAWQTARDALPDRDDPWTPALQARTQAMLEAIKEEHRAQLERGEKVDYPALLAARDPELERGFRDSLKRYQQRARALAAEAADLLVAAFAAAPEDPYLWLEEVDGAAALDQVRVWNAATDAGVRSDAAFVTHEARARAILEDNRRIAMPTPFGGYIYNFWSDADHVRGIWRRSPEAAYLAGAPEWDVLIDVDALGREEGANWVWGGAMLRRPDGDRCMVSLSDGGRDAATWREFDLTTRRFVEGGFVVPEAKTRLTWLDRDTLLVASDFGAGTLTRSEYAREVRRWARGTVLGDAPVVDRVAVDDMLILPIVSHDSAGVWTMVLRSRSFWTSQLMHVGADGTLHPSPLPDHALLYGTLGGHVIAKLQQDSDAGPAGTLVAYAIADLLAGRATALETVLRPPADGANEGVAITRSRLFVSRLENVVGNIVAIERHGPDDWRATPLSTPENSALFLVGANSGSERLFYVSVGMTRPQTLHLYDPGEPQRVIAAAPERFDPARFTVSQRFATSADGTRIPYFLVLPRDADGPVPTLLYAYGGFRESQIPGYIGPVAQSLLESGMGYAVANIRGGGEFGPGWHAAALRENRQRSFDDFHAVAAALKDDGIASRVAIHGGSNGGLLVGAAYTQRPQLYDAVVMAVPLADMKRYHKLLAGASWIAEYGDPDKPEDWAFIRRYSPYHNLRADAAYPPVLFRTSTKDDRVHPAHARKMAARMAALGHSFDYFENIDGGHGGSADSGQAAYQVALMVVWLKRQLTR